MMNCPSCDQQVSNDSSFCINCGFKLDKDIKKTVINDDNVNSKIALIKQNSHNSGTRLLNKITIGRGDENVVVLKYNQISWKHACLIKDKNKWILEDLKSTNHTFINDRSKKITKAEITEKDTIFFGSYKISAKRLIDKYIEFNKGIFSTNSFNIEEKETTFGRDPNSTVYLNYPQISWHHAKIIRKGSDYFLKDLSSTNGTYVNGKRISSSKIAVNDTITLGSFSFTLNPDQKIEKKDLREDIRLDSEKISFEVADKKNNSMKKILDDISFTIYPSEFVGLMGPAGAGKTTLMLAMNGYLPPTKGFSKINGQSLYGNYDAFRGNIGYVPQDDIIHPELTVYEALYYTAKLRLPDDTKIEEIDALIEKIMTQLGLIVPSKQLDIRNVIIGSPVDKGISGGQRKRVNLAMELLTAPSVLFLDEPTSGLSSHDTLIVMDVLRKLADEGKTIILTIHQPSLEAYKKMDNVIIVSSGKLMYYGPTYPDSLTFFNPNKNSENVIDNADNALKGLSERPENIWQEKYRKSDYYKNYVESRRDTQKIINDSKEKLQKPSRDIDINQWWTLTSRYFTIKKKDIINTTILLIQAPIIGLLISLVFYKASPIYNPATPLFLLVVSALWFGTSNSAREIVSERSIYMRERMVNLKIPSYIFSKFAVQSLLCLIQCVMLVSIVYFFLDFNGNIETFINVTFLASLVGISIGLFISCVTKTQQQAVAIVPLVLIPMIIIGGGILPIKEMNTASKAISYLIPARWSYEQIIHVEDEGIRDKLKEFNEIYPFNKKVTYSKALFGKHERNDFIIFLVIIGFIAGFLRLTIMVLKRRDII